MDFIKIYYEEYVTEMRGGGQDYFGFGQRPETVSQKNNKEGLMFQIQESWNFNSGNYLFTTDTKQIHVSKFYCPSMQFKPL